jgi:hypothetical protein
MTRTTLGDRIGQLEDELKQRDARIKELRGEVDEGRRLLDEMREQLEQSNELIDSWIEAFDMTMNDEGAYHWKAGFLAAYNGVHAENQQLIQQWNKFVPEYNATVAPRSIGRPLAASEQQIAEVLRLRKEGQSLRAIAMGTSLTMRTVRTIVGRQEGTDRTTQKTNRLRRLELNRARMAAWRARKRVRDALPNRINETLERGRELVKQARGLK